MLLKIRCAPFFKNDEQGFEVSFFIVIECKDTADGARKYREAMELDAVQNDMNLKPVDFYFEIGGVNTSVLPIEDIYNIPGEQ